MRVEYPTDPSLMFRFHDFIYRWNDLIGYDWRATVAFCTAANLVSFVTYALVLICDGAIELGIEQWYSYHLAGWWGVGLYATIWMVHHCFTVWIVGAYFDAVRPRYGWTTRGLNPILRFARAAGGQIPGVFEVLSHALPRKYREQYFDPAFSDLLQDCWELAQRDRGSAAITAMLWVQGFRIWLSAMAEAYSPLRWVFRLGLLKSISDIVKTIFLP